MAALKSQPGGPLLILGGPHQSGSLARAAPLDELRLRVYPVILGQGHSLFEGPDQRLDLGLLRTRQFDSGNPLLTYQPQPSSV